MRHSQIVYDIMEVIMDNNENITASCEELMVKDQDLYNAISKATLTTDRKSLYKQLRPGDMLMIYRNPKKQLLVGKIFYKISTSSQGSSFSSLKMLGVDKSTVYGYGVVLGHNKFMKTDTMSFLETCSGVLVLRNPSLDPYKLRLLQDWMEDRLEKVPYTYSKAAQSIYGHFIKHTSKTVTEEEAKETFIPMFCSTIFAYGMTAVGIKTGLKFNNIDLIWPKDWAVASNFKPLISYFSPDEKAEKVLSISDESIRTNTSNQKHCVLKKVMDYTPEIKKLLLEVSNLPTAIPGDSQSKMDHIDKLINGKDSDAYLVMCDENIIGAVWIGNGDVGKDGDTVPGKWFHDYGILTQYQGQGYGVAGVHAIIEYCKMNYPGLPIGLIVDTRNKKAIHTYMKCGFKIVQEWSDKHLVHMSYVHTVVSDESIEASTEAVQDIAKKKAAVIKHICSIMDIMDPSGLNSKRYHNMLDHMSAAEFDKWMHYVKEGKWQIHITAPNITNNLSTTNLLKAADAAKCKLFHKLWMTDDATGQKYLTDSEFLVLNLPIRRQQQFLDEKMSVPDNDRKIDGMTGQVTGDSRSSSITNPEINILAARGLDATLKELVNVRGGNIAAYSEFRRQAEEGGSITLESLNTGSVSRVAMTGQVLLASAMIDSNMVEG